MDDIRLDEDDTNVVLEWALATASMAILLRDVPEPSNPEELALRIMQLESGIELMVASIPECLQEYAEEFALEVAVEAEQEEEMVEQFIKELEEFDGH